MFSSLDKTISSALNTLLLLVVLCVGLVLYDFFLSTLKYLLMSSSINSCLGSHMVILSEVVSDNIRKHSLTEN